MGDLKAATEQYEYWKDLLTSLEMQSTAQHKKLSSLQEAIKGIEDEGQKFTALQARYTIARSTS